MCFPGDSEIKPTINLRNDAIDRMDATSCSIIHEDYICGARWLSGIEAGLAIERAREGIPFDTVSKLGHFRSFDDATVYTAV